MCPKVHAVLVENLYSATVPVADKSELQRNRAIQRGFGDVLVKVTGSRGVLKDPGVLDILSQAQRYVVEYGYLDQTSLKSPETQLKADPGTGAEGQIVNPLANNELIGAPLNLKVRYAMGPVQTALRDLLLPVWPADRPVLMLWQVKSTPEGYQFVEYTDSSGGSKSLGAALQRRGIPFKVPLYDLQDRMSVTAEQVWRGAEQLNQASRRYGIDHWLVVKLADDKDKQALPGEFSGGWILGGGMARSSGNNAAQSIPQLADQTIDAAADQYSMAFTYRAGQLAETVRLLVTGIKSYRDFSSLTSLLAELEIVASSQVTRVEGDHLYLDLTTEGGAQVLINALGSDSHFSRVVDIGDSIDQALYRFQWRAGNL